MTILTASLALELVDEQGLDVVIPDIYTSIASSVFNNNQLTSVDIPTSVTSIGSSAFRDNQLTSIEIPESVTSIGSDAFRNNQLTEIVIPNSVTNIYSNAFLENEIKTLEIGGGISIVPQLSAWGLSSGTIENLILKEGIESIDNQAFANTQITTVEIPDSVTSIGYSAFYNNQLTSVVIPDSVTSIRSSVFDTNQLTSVEIPASVTSIGSSAFRDNQLTSIEIPDSVTSIGSDAFRNNQLTEIVIPNSVTNIYSNAFLENEIKTLEIGGGISIVPQLSAWGLSSGAIENLILKEGIESIDNQAFANTQITTVEIPDSVTSIGYSAFYNNQLTSVVIPDSVTSIRSSVFDTNQLTSVEIPASVTSIGHNAFRNNQLTSIEIPDSVTSIGSDAFRDNPLERVVVPADSSFNLSIFPDGILVDRRGINDIPVEIFISESNFDENLLNGVAIATLTSSDPDLEISHTYSLVTGFGDDDNSEFIIDGDQLMIVDSPDFEDKSTYSVRVQTTDSGGLTFERSFVFNVNDLNEDPFDLNISTSTFDENILGGSTVGTLATTDPDLDDIYTYALISGDGDADNSAFSIEGNQLRIVDSPDYETKSIYSIRLQTTDTGGVTFEDSFTLLVNDLIEDLDGNGFVDSVYNYQIWTESGGIDLTSKNGRKLSDQTSESWDAIKAVSADNGFSILLEGDREYHGKYSVLTAYGDGRISSQSPWQSAQQMFDLGNEDIFDIDLNGNGQIGFVAPTEISLSTIIFNENIPKGSTVSTLSSADLDPDDTHTYSLVSGSGDNDNGVFMITGDQLMINTSPDYESKNSYSIRLRTTDSSGGLSCESQFTLSVNDLDESDLSDLDGDGDGFVDEITNYQMWTASGGVDLRNRQGRTYSDDTSRQWDLTKAVVVDSGFSILLEGDRQKDGSYRVISARENGLMSGVTGWMNERQMFRSGYEEIFGVDFNGNGVVDFV